MKKLYSDSGLKGLIRIALSALLCTGGTTAYSQIDINANAARHHAIRFGLVTGYFLALLAALFLLLPSTGSGRAVLVAGGALGLGLGLAATLVLLRTVAVQMGGDPAKVLDLLRRVAEGDLRVDVETRPGDWYSLMAMVQATQSRMKRIINRIRFDAGRVADDAEVLTALTASDEGNQSGQAAMAAIRTSEGLEELVGGFLT